MPSSKMNFAEAVDYAASLHRSGVRMGLAVAKTAEKTGYNARELAQALAERSHRSRRAKARRERKVTPFPSTDTEAYRRASRGY